MILNAVLVGALVMVAYLKTSSDKTSTFLTKEATWKERTERLTGIHLFPALCTRS